MDKRLREKLLPVDSSIKKEKKKEPELKLNGTISVNKLFTKPKDPLDIKLEQFQEVKNEIPKKPSNNYKQERLNKLNRGTKLKNNEKITDYLENKKHSVYSKANKLKNLKNIDDQISDALNQITEAKKIINMKNTKPNKKNSINKTLDGLEKTRSRKTVASDTGVKHMCTKTLRNKINNYNTIIEKIEKQLNWQTDKLPKNSMKPNNSFNNSTPVVNYLQKSFHSKVNSFNSFKTDNTFSKFGNNTSELVKFKKRQPRYKSLKDVKINEDKLKEYEEGVKRRCQLPNEMKEMKVLYENNEIFKNKVTISECNSEESLINREKGKFNYNDLMMKLIKIPQSVDSSKNKTAVRDDIEDIKRQVAKCDGWNSARTHKSSGMNSPTSRNEYKKPKNMFQFVKVSPRKTEFSEIYKSMDARVNLNIKPETETKSISVETNPESTDISTAIMKTIYKTKNAKVKSKFNTNADSGNKIIDPNSEKYNDLSKSIMKSDYLMREFDLSAIPGMYPVPKLPDSPVELVNWADKFKAVKPKWPKELQHLVS